MDRWFKRTVGVIVILLVLTAGIFIGLWLSDDVDECVGSLLATDSDSRSTIDPQILEEKCGPDVEPLGTTAG